MSRRFYAGMVRSLRVVSSTYEHVLRQHGGIPPFSGGFLALDSALTLATEKRLAVRG